jgi:predicted 3-demethylubiquinone-9 3-methyltransferase (glyoxalase superfamily)
MSPLTPCIWLDGTAGAAVDLYLCVFPNWRRTSPATSGESLVVEFELDGTPFQALNGGPYFTLSPAVSFVVSCRTQEEVDHYWNGLVEGGASRRNVAG